MKFGSSIRKIIRQTGHDIIQIKNKSLPERFPIGHFYSVIPSENDIRENISDSPSEISEIKSINLNIQKQLDILSIFKNMDHTPPFYSQGKKIRFNIENNSFSYDDAPVLSYMIRYLKPKRIIEIGSGYSSSCMLDTDDIYLGGNTDFIFIDVNCDNLRKNLLKKDLEKVKIIESPIQKVDRNIFSDLVENDLLLIDSSHVIKIGSDLQTIFFELLPSLNRGVYIHFHDIRYPFEYRKEIVTKNIYWNEAYLLRAFLMNNDCFEIIFWLNYLINSNIAYIENMLSFLPLQEWDKRFGDGTGNFSGAGGSIYLKKIR